MCKYMYGDLVAGKTAIGMTVAQIRITACSQGFYEGLGVLIRTVTGTVSLMWTESTSSATVPWTSPRTMVELERWWIRSDSLRTGSGLGRSRDEGVDLIFCGAIVNSDDSKAEHPLKTSGPDEERSSASCRNEGRMQPTWIASWRPRYHRSSTGAGSGHGQDLNQVITLIN